MDNLISRQAALDALEKCHKQCCREDVTGDEWIHYETTLNEVESILPAQPEIVTCDRCVATKLGECIWHNAGATYCSLGEETT